MELLDLFAGIGGFSLAAHWMNWQTIAFVEKDGFCQQVLRKNFGADIDLYDDINTFSGLAFRGRCDIVTAGFPCQDISNANTDGKGLDGERSGLWRAGFRVIAEAQPGWAVIENVANYKKLGVDRLCGELEKLGYETATVDIPACCVGLPTLERHVWIIAASDALRLQRLCQSPPPELETQKQLCGSYPGIRNGRRISESRFRSVGERVSRRLVQFERNAVEAYGNAIVPQIAYEIFKAIEAAESNFIKLNLSVYDRQQKIIQKDKETAL